jgi:hypothetical protein
MENGDCLARPLSGTANIGDKFLVSKSTFPAVFLSWFGNWPAIPESNVIWKGVSNVRSVTSLYFSLMLVGTGRRPPRTRLPAQPIISREPAAVLRRRFRPTQK